MGSSYINHFIQPDSLIPDPSNPQSWNRYAYVLNNPVRYNDPSGHCPVCFVVGTLTLVAAAAIVVTQYQGTVYDLQGVYFAEKYVPNTGDVKDTFVAGGIAVQSNWYPLGDIPNPFDADNSGLGLAQVSRNQLDNELGMPGANPHNPNVAVNAMAMRIYPVLNECNKGQEITCSSTDKFIAAALAQNSGFFKENMSALIKSNLRLEFDPNNPNQALLPWKEMWFDKRDPKNSAYDKFMLKLFTNDTRELRNRGWAMPEVDWGFITSLSKGGRRSKWR